MTNYQDKARQMVSDYYNSHKPVDESFPHILPKDIFVVWFTKTLGNWKALLSTNAHDGRYYEVTYNGAKGEAYLDVYEKLENVCVPDEPGIEEHAAVDLETAVIAISVNETGANAQAMYYTGRNSVAIDEFLKGAFPENVPSLFPVSAGCWFVRDDEWCQVVSEGEFRQLFTLR